MLLQKLRVCKGRERQLYAFNKSLLKRLKQLKQCTSILLLEINYTPTEDINQRKSVIIRANPMLT